MADLKYSSRMSGSLKEDGLCVIGITLYKHSLGDIVFINLPGVDDGNSW